MSLSFAGENLAVVTDGGGVLHLIDTFQRNTSQLTPWKVLVYHLPVLAIFINFVLLFHTDSILQLCFWHAQAVQDSSFLP